MDNYSESHFNDDLSPITERPQFLKILCVLSFVSCGLMIILFTVGLSGLFISEDVINDLWSKVIATQPQFESINGVEFMRAMGVASLYNLIGNIISVIGVAMMWKLNKAGLIIYAVAEITVNFFGIKLDSYAAESSNAGIIFFILMDLVFIAMYAANLKYMHKKPTVVG